MDWQLGMLPSPLRGEGPGVRGFLIDVTSYLYVQVIVTNLSRYYCNRR